MSRHPKRFESYKREYNIWALMKQRCRNPKAANYVNYGAKGVTVAPEFERFEGFLAALGPAPTPQHTLDRIDNSLGYSAANCRWADVHTQQNNRTNGVHYEHEGQLLSAPQLARLVGSTPDRMMHRLKKLGMTPEQAMTYPKMSWVQLPVVRRTLDGQFIQRFASLAAAATAVTPTRLEREKTRKTMWQAIHRRKAYLGSLWAYEDSKVLSSPP